MITNGEFYKCEKHNIVNNTGYCNKCVAESAEKVNEEIGKTDLSFILDSLYNKGKISAEALEHYYSEIHVLVNKFAAKEYDRGRADEKAYQAHMED